MTSQEAIKKIDKQLSEIEAAGYLLTSVTEAHTRQVKRIFDEGLNSNGQKIGEYNSTDPIYVSPDASPKKFPTKGKNGETTFKNGASHKTGYFDSYRAFRQTIDKRTDRVDLWLTGNLRFDFTNSLTQIGNIYQTGVKRDENADKVDGSIKKYGEEVWRLSEEEKKAFLDSVQKKLHDTLNK